MASETHLGPNALFWIALAKFEYNHKNPDDIIDMLNKSDDSNLVFQEIDINEFLMQDPECRTPLCVAIKTGSTKLVEALLNYGANCNQVRYYMGYDEDDIPRNIYWVPLQDALELKDGGFEMMELLLKWGADPNVILMNGTTLLHTLSCTRFIPDHVKRLQLLLSHIKQSNLPMLINSRETTDTTTVLINAIESLVSRDWSFKPIVNILLKTGLIDLEAQSKYGLTAMVYCITHMKDDCYIPGAIGPHVLKNLLMHGAKTDTRNGTNGETALHIAVKLRKQWAIWILLTADADPDAPDKNGVTPLHLAHNQPPREYPRTIKTFAEFDAKMKICNDKCFAFAMGHHNRLGEGSRVSNLEQELTRIITRYAQGDPGSASVEQR